MPLLFLFKCLLANVVEEECDDGVDVNVGGDVFDEVSLYTEGTTFGSYNISLWQFVCICFVSLYFTICLAVEQLSTMTGSSVHDNALLSMLSFGGKVFESALTEWSSSDIDDVCDVSVIGMNTEFRSKVSFKTWHDATNTAFTRSNVS